MAAGSSALICAVYHPLTPRYMCRHFIEESYRRIIQRCCSCAAWPRICQCSVRAGKIGLAASRLADITLLKRHSVSRSGACSPGGTARWGARWRACPSAEWRAAPSAGRAWSPPCAPSALYLGLGVCEGFTIWKTCPPNGHASTIAAGQPFINASATASTSLAAPSHGLLCSRLHQNTHQPLRWRTPLFLMKCASSMMTTLKSRSWFLHQANSCEVAAMHVDVPLHAHIWEVHKKKDQRHELAHMHLPCFEHVQTCQRRSTAD